VPAGTEMPVKSRTLPKCVNSPRMLFLMIGSARTSATVQCVGVEGTTRMKGPTLLEANTRSAWRVYL
jgi:hypothetical protein